MKKTEKNDILKYSDKWILKKLNLFNPYSGITNNISEGMNTVLKRLVDLKEVPLDTVVFCISYLQNYYWNEILRGFCDMGNYRLKSIFSYLHLPVEEVSFPTNIYQPDLIIDKCQERIKMILGKSEEDPITTDHGSKIPKELDINKNENKEQISK